jgi:hypothetical protein
MISKESIKIYHKENWWLLFETSPRVMHKRSTSIILSYVPLAALTCLTKDNIKKQKLVCIYTCCERGGIMGKNNDQPADRVRFPKWADIGILCITVSFVSLPFLFGLTDVIRILHLHFVGKYSEAQNLSLIVVQLRCLPSQYWTCLILIIAFWFGRGIMYYIKNRTGY